MAADPTSDPLEELRRIVVGPYESRAEALTTSDLAERLPEVIETRMAQDDALSTALQLPVIQAFLHLAKTDPELVVSALYPVMLPAIRMAVEQSVRSAMEGVNNLAASAVSPRALQWRFQSLVTGRPLAEIALADTLLWRVRQTMIVHRESALVIGHAMHGTVENSDPDQVAAMLDAISSFAAESFGLDATETGIDALNVGGLTVWIERGPSLLGALVIEGPAPVTLRDDLAAVLTQLHQAGAGWMDGQRELPEAEQEGLKNLLRVQTSVQKASPLPAIVLCAMLALIGLALTVGWIWDGVQTRGTAAELGEEAGVTLIEARRGWLGWSTLFLVDPSVKDFDARVTEAGLTGWRHEVRTEPSLSMDVAVVRARLEETLPEGVAASWSDRDVVLTGSAPSEALGGLAGLSALPGVGRVDASGVRSAEQIQALARIEAWRVELPFKPAVTTVPSGAVNFAEVARLARRAGRSVRVIATVGVDSIGSDAVNRRFAEERLNTLQSLALRAGLPLDGRLVTPPAPGAGRVVSLRLELDPLTPSP